MKKSLLVRKRSTPNLLPCGPADIDPESLDTSIEFKWAMSGISTTRHTMTMTTLRQKLFRDTNSISSIQISSTRRKHRRIESNGRAVANGASRLLQQAKRIHVSSASSQVLHMKTLLFELL